MTGRRADGTNPRALGTNPRALRGEKRRTPKKLGWKVYRTAASLRRGVPRWLRFEILKRDKFTCQYCGARAPDVALHVDHILSKAKGGLTEARNLITACENCNGGKDARGLEESLL